MPTKQHQLIRDFYQRVWNEQDINVIDELCHPDLEFKGSIDNTTYGIEGLKHYARQITSCLGNYHCDVKIIIVENTKAYARVVFSGVHQGKFLGFEPTGEWVRWTGGAEIKFEDDLIRKMWVLGDLQDLIQQLTAAKITVPKEDMCPT